jgi:hypothetical protein
MSGSICWGRPRAKQKAPSPSSPASVKVPGLPAATHMAGWAAPWGQGKIFRSGTEKCRPS